MRKTEGFANSVTDSVIDAVSNKVSNKVSNLITKRGGSYFGEQRKEARAAFLLDGREHVRSLIGLFLWW